MRLTKGHGRMPNHMLGSLLKKHFPGLVQLKSDKPAMAGFTWEHHKAAKDKRDVSKAEHVCREFWNHFACKPGFEDHAAKVIEYVAKGRLYDMMHNVCIAAVQRARPMHSEGRKMTSSLACSTYDLEPAEYLAVKEPWIPTDCWEALVEDWCSAEWLAMHKVKRGDRLKMPGLAHV